MAAQRRSSSLDVTDTAGVNAVVAAAAQRFGGLDVVVANAGIAHRVPLAELDDARWDPRWMWI